MNHQENRDVTIRPALTIHPNFKLIFSYCDNFTMAQHTCQWEKKDLSLLKNITAELKKEKHHGPRFNVQRYTNSLKQYTGMKE